MDLTEAELKQAIKEAIKEELHESCVCGLTHDAQLEMGHLMGMVRDVGNGSHSAGVETIREDLKFLSRYKKRGEKIGLVIVTLHLCVAGRWSRICFQERNRTHIWTMSDAMEEMTITAKDQAVFENLFYVAWHPALVDLVEWVNMAILDPFPVITSAYRPGDKGVHGTDPLRAIDIRSRRLDATAVCEKINRHWQYDSTRPKLSCAIYHDVGRGPHIHLQVHDSTCIIKGGWGELPGASRRYVKECKV